MAYTAKDPCSPQHFLYLRETTSWRWEEGEGGGGKKVSLKTHATARGMGKNLVKYKTRQLLLLVAALFDKLTWMTTMTTTTNKCLSRAASG